jgi:hypothetical protein
MDFSRTSERTSSEENFRSDTIRATWVVGKNMLEVIEEKGLQQFRHVKRMTGNRLPRRIQERESEEKRRKGTPKERWMDGWKKACD